MATEYSEIPKDPAEFAVKPHLADHAKDCADWSWDRVWEDLNPPVDRVNLAHVCVDRHTGRTNPAMIWEGGDGSVEKYSFSQMKTQSDRFANVLKKLGVGKADRVFFLADRIPDLYFAMF